MVCVSTGGILGLNGANGVAPLSATLAGNGSNHRSIGVEAGYGAADEVSLNNSPIRQLVGGAYVSDSTEINMYAFYNGIPGFSAPSVSSTNINEGQSVTLTWTSTNVVNGTNVAWSITGASGAAVGISPGTSGTITFNNNSASLTLTLLQDMLTEGVGFFKVTISRSGVVVNSAQITVNDTSLTPSFSSVPANINEGANGTFYVNAPGSIPGTAFYWTISHGSTSAADFAASSGSFTVDGSSGSFTISPVADSTSEGAAGCSPYFKPGRLVGGPETFSVQLRRGSIGGALLSTSAQVTVNDTSLTPLNPLTYTYTSNVADATLLICQSSGGAGYSYSGGPYQLCRANTVNIVINSGVALYATFLGAAGLVLTGGRSDDTVNLTVNGAIMGNGGTGGNTTVGCAGGPALKLGIQNINLGGSGYIMGGGGGGGSAAISSRAGPGGGGAGGGNGGGRGSFVGGAIGAKGGGADGGFNCTYACSGTKYPAGGGGRQWQQGCIGYGVAQLITTPYNHYANHGIGGSAGGGGGSAWCYSFNINIKGGNGGTYNNAGGAAPGGSGYAASGGGGGGGGYGAQGGTGNTYDGTSGTYSRAGGAGGKAVCLNGRSVSGSVSNTWGAVS